ncbi:hypothetical protein [Chryseobacterium chendengshani]|uniref:hypothetical protein n=1 Tax=unclassified Chryseobacterium TaxID=2593645 RepID=UPI001C642887|nr:MULTISPECIES: hypothetical protein [unclassified Chryseobacterium]MBW7675499.1 hypothetical protein [Chryseobacterium sp. LJ756]MBW8521938.1 hypothetical protein [Chryseobacterium sp. LJ668]QYK17594.1 hypothetical protein K0U91_05575 [Chryseobacterium sp. LJ668]
MEVPNHNTDTIIDSDIYTISWSDIENTEPDYENYLTDIENFFREDSENDLTEEEFMKYN